MGIEQPLLLDLPHEWSGERVVLRAWRDEHAEALFAAILASREHIARWLPWATSYQTADDARVFVRRMSSHWAISNHLGLGIFRRADGVLLGSIGVTARDWGVPAFELGYWIGREAEGLGYTSEAVRVMTRYLFEELGAGRVMIRCDARNARSRAVPERLGFNFEGRLRRDSLGADGSIRDTLVFAMVPADYARARLSWPARAEEGFVSPTTGEGGR